MKIILICCVVTFTLSLFVLWLLDVIIEYYNVIRRMCKKKESGVFVMKTQDIRMDIVDQLEKYCNQRDIPFAWVLEGKSEGCLVVQFVRPDHTGHLTYRVNYSEIESINGDINVLINRIIEKIKELCE